jgi:methionyl aminopeptidase
VNEEVVHGIPGKRKLAEGDLVGVDVGAIVEGYYADAARTYAVGSVSKAANELIRVTRDSLLEGQKQVQTGNRISDISHAVETHISRFGYGIVKNYVGHGIGSSLHEEPQIPNYGPPNRGPVIKEGMALAIEPMVTMGSGETCVLEDGWTVVTKDKSMACHFENTLLVTGKGVEVITE